MKLPLSWPWPPKPVRLAPPGSISGHVLLSYLRAPFERGLDSPQARGHTNWFECKSMADAFVAAGFCVDVVERNDPRVFPGIPYDYVIDIHNNLERWSHLLPPACVKILHATGAHWLTQNAAELDRLLALRERRGVSLVPRRQARPVASVEHSDRITVLGNRFTSDSFRFSGRPVHRIPISSAYAFAWPGKRDWAKIRTRFLWMGSYGMVHKGLDLVLEAFAGQPHLQLTLCGRPEKEEDFFRLYENELTRCTNIQRMGWVDPGSVEFERIRREHAAMIYPSCSEGGGGALIHAMHGGLLPVATPAASVDLEDFGERINEGSVEAVRQAALLVASLSEQEWEARCRASWEFVRLQHTREQFARNYRNFVIHLTGEGSNE